MQHNARPEARKRLRALGAGDADHAWATLVLAHATLNDEELDAIRLYEMAADGFVRTRAAEGEVVARQNLRMVYQRRGMADAAARQVALATAAADASKQPLAIARASVLEASHLLEVGGDVGRAERVLLRAAQLSFPSGPIALRRAVLFNLGLAHLNLGRLDAAIDAWERHRALRKEDGSTTDASAVAFNLLNARMTQHEMRPVPSARARLLAHAEDLVAEAQTPPRPFIEAQAHRLLADLLKPSDPDRAIAHLQRCLEIEAPLGHPNVRAACLWALSRHEAVRNPARADEFSRDAIALVAANRSGLLLAFAWQARLRMVWQTLDEERAISDSLEALAAIERFRAGQKDEASRAALFSGWTRDYYWLTGRLLDLQPPRIGTAFAVGEQLRSRVLLDRLTSAGIPHDEDETGAVARQQLTARLATIQRRLLSAALAASERAALVDQLALLELERQEIGDGGAPAADVEALPFASLDAVQQTLGPGEAMLWYSIAPWKNLYDEFGGGAWVLAITRDAVKMQRLDTRVEIDSQIAALTGLLSARDTSPAVWSTPAKQLGRTLLASALAALPRAVERLVIVSDGALHRLPFEALPVGDDARPLGERFEIAVVPSATLWLRLRRAAAQGPAGTALVLSDPDVPRGTPGGDLRLDPLPWARREAAAIASLLDLDASSVKQGSDASERRLKDTPLGNIVHLAAHARADDAFPERSAVFLAPGTPDEDGWLQPREIAALDLRGALVVLSACDSAEGALLSGEGPLSLARAFFAGGAGAVVATRWPLRDDDAAFVMERFYRALAAGATTGAALRRARQDTIDAGRPAAVWAGVVLLGDGSRIPVRVQPRSTIPWPAMMAFSLALGAAAIGWLALRRG